MGQAEHTEEDAVDGWGATVLVVEDDVLVRIDTAEHLRRRGYRVVEAQTADEAVLVIQAGESVMVVFSDIPLPGSLGGLSFAVWLRANFRPSPLF